MHRFHNHRQPAGALFLEGLFTFLPQSSAIPNPPIGPKTTKRDRKLLQKRQLQLQDAQSSLVMQQLSPSALSHLSSEPSTFGSSFETLGVLLMVLLVGLIVHFTLGPLIGLWQEILLFTLGPMVVMWALSQLIMVECGGSLRRLMPGGDRFRVLVLAGLGGLAAYGILMAAPPGWIRWDVREAAKHLDQFVNVGVARLLAARVRHYQPPPPLHSDPGLVAGGLAVVAGLLGAALMGPAARIAKLYSYTSPVPFWAAKYLTPHPAAKAAVHLSLVLPLLVVLYGIVPMSDFLAPLTAAAALGPALVVAAAAAQLFAIRPLAAAHLGGGLLEWHVLRHEALPGGGGGGAGGNTALQGAREVLIRKRLHLVYATVCQVALQLLAPAAILACLALMYGGASGVMDSFRPAQPLLLVGKATAATSPPQQQQQPAVGPPPGSQSGMGIELGLRDGLAAAATAQPGLTAVAASDDVFLDGLDGMTSSEEAAAAAAAATAWSIGSVHDGGSGRGSGSGGDVGQGVPVPLLPLDFVSFASSFLSWWWCFVMCLFTYPLLFVYRTGLHVG
ncbi:hypothetical protein VOLCADRAFT_94071 [Volvox carteri f. nagariensis]|uniref:Uncharacterized protein n=1 Tax=Volvox carteri f. nagariensis TaxID=3068 RepID=D8U3U5_VOLCA|nr:uncharacterized protein VOLCADRAFT_94071 [Volvox carteri f. nagariensis]EFJ45671.1 hypothetical protein VOLCADRAFT_94071 [Volvox carteri f. nagariensis]|eukprot:XP_002953361.1 hypothetical protein VOLCADRAFT_94071 [Volvox carteri f. nagariensis]